MKNKGYITVFLTLLLLSLLMVFTAVFTLADKRNAESRANIAFRSAMSAVRAEYSRYIFDKYHVLLLDADLDGEGTGKLEALAEERLQADLGEDFSVGQVSISGMTRIMEDDLAAFKEQVEQVLPYIAADKGVELIKSKVNGNDSPVNPAYFEEGDRASQGGKIDGDSDLKKLAEEAGTDDEEETDDENDKNDKVQKADGDPRMRTRMWKGVGVAYMIAPEDLELKHYAFCLLRMENLLVW